MSDNQKKEEYLELIRKILDEIQFGSVTIVIQNGKIMQVEKEEKIRL
ncbi:MAG: YezD family protein [Robinsoniella sp.]|nr:YezD family protein [Robinsoniella sp.]